MSDGLESAAEFQMIVSSAEQTIASAVTAFADWMAVTWTMTEKEWLHDMAEDPPKGTYFDGFNAGVESVKDAAKFFIGDFGP